MKVQIELAMKYYTTTKIVVTFLGSQVNNILHVIKKKMYKESTYSKNLTVLLKGMKVLAVSIHLCWFTKMPRETHYLFLEKEIVSELQWQVVFLLKT